MTAEEFEALKKFLTKTPAAVRELIAGLTENQTRRKPSQTEFSVVENICHLRDIEAEGYQKRIRRILTEDMPFLPDLDGSRLALERRYNEQELEAALEAFTVARDENMRTIQSLSAEQLTRGGTFEQIGPLTLQRLLLMMQEHDRAHLLELKDVRRRLA